MQHSQFSSWHDQQFFAPIDNLEENTRKRFPWELPNHEVDEDEYMEYEDNR